MIGFGYDVHRLVEGKNLILGGIKIESPFGCQAHSDGDVVIHALCDALFGAVGLGDIGEHFPDNDPAYLGIDSQFLLEETLKQIKGEGFEIVNIDITIKLEKPKLKDYKVLIRSNISEICKLDIQKVNIKAKTSELLGFVGSSEGVEAYCICELQSKI